MISTKQQLYNQCSEFVTQRSKAIQNTIEKIQESLSSETKSSAGDKHETGRAMLQLEREKAGNQLAEIQKLQEALSKINSTKSSKTICLGSVVITSKANYFLAISAGEFIVNNKTFYAISPSTPIGKLLIGNAVGDTINFRDLTFQITSVL